MVAPSALTLTTPPTEGDRDVRSARAATVALVGLGALWLLTSWWGYRILERVHLKLAAPPLSGSWTGRVDATTILALLTGAVVVAAAPRLALRLRWPLLVATVVATAAVFTVLVNLNDADGLTRGISSRQSYLAAVPLVDDPLVFVDQYVDVVRDPDTPVHAQGHPPGFVLVLWLFAQLGLGGAGPAAILCIAGGCAALAAVVVALRDVAGEDRARRAAPFLAVTPAALWIGTSPDAFFAGVTAWGVAALVLATSRSGRAGDRLAVAGGLLVGGGMMLSYGLVLVAAIPLLVAGWRRRLRPLLVALGAATLVVVAFAPFGFWWSGGLAATQDRYWAGIAGVRPLRFFLVANVVALGLCVGPAVVVALAWLRDRATWVLVGGALGAVALANLSGYSKGEVERIWLPFAVWILAASSALWSPAAPRSAQWFLAVQVAFTVLLGAAIRTAW